MDDKIEINKGYMSIQTAFAIVAEREMSETEKKKFEKSHKNNARIAYEDIKKEYLEDHDARRFIVNISGNSALCIQACFADSEFINSLPSQTLRSLVINSFTHEGHDVPRVRQRMKTIVKKYPDQFSDEIVAEFME